MTVYNQVSGFFDSTKIIDTVEGFPRGDKAVDAEFLADFVSTFFSDGVAKNYKNGFAVTTDGASAGVVTVGAGACLIRGRYALDKGPETLDLGFSEDSRTVIIAQRLDITTAPNAAITKTVITTLTDAPVNTATVQDIWLAKVTIPGGTVNITQNMITDLRGSTYCPWIIAPLADTDWEALPATVSNGFTRIATANGGTGDAFTATVPNFNSETDQYANLAIRIVPAANSNANATLKVNGGAAYPLYKSDGDPCALYSLRAGIPVDVIFHEGKYFFKSAGSGAEFTKYATGTFEQTADATWTNPWVLTASSLTFKPRLLICEQQSEVSRNSAYAHYAVIVFFDASGAISFSLFAGSGKTETPSGNVGTCTGQALDNGFNITVIKPGWDYKNSRDNNIFYAYA
nr:MAG TPA: Receptor Binding Protein [Caudoviricetes sp.]